MIKRFLKISFLISLAILSISSCSKVEEEINLTNGRTTANFNPDVTYGTMTDQDGNIYKTVTIGTQVWMAENLRTTIYNNGTNISNVTDGDEWRELTTGAYCNYNNTTDIDTIATYGRFYNGFAIRTGKLAPQGWHVPTLEEWNTLIDYLGGIDIAGSKLKETGTEHTVADYNNADATNESGFTALPAGYHLFSSFHSMGEYSCWRTSTDYIKSVGFDNSWVGTSYSSTGIEGCSVRCVKD